MPLHDDDEVCLCFHVPLRKIESFCRREKPRAASQISDCLSAGTGCGWCIPMLRKIHLRICGPYLPPWRQEQDDPAAYHSPERDASDQVIEPADYVAGRAKYLQEKRKSASPQPPEEPAK